MGGRRITVEQDKLVKVINDLENQKTYSSLIQLQNDVVNSEYGRQIGITAPNVYNYIKKWNIQIKTKAGRGTDSLSRLRNSSNVVRVTRGEKIQQDPQGQTWIQAVRNHFKFLCGNKLGRFQKSLTKLEAGSLKAAVGLKCVECCGGDTIEIRECVCMDCPLYYFRPYKQGDDHLASIEIDDDSINSKISV